MVLGKVFKKLSFLLIVFSIFCSHKVVFADVSTALNTLKGKLSDLSAVLSGKPVMPKPKPPVVPPKVTPEVVLLTEEKKKELAQQVIGHRSFIAKYKYPDVDPKAPAYANPIGLAQAALSGLAKKIGEKTNSQDAMIGAIKAFDDTKKVEELITALKDFTFDGFHHIIGSLKEDGTANQEVTNPLIELLENRKKEIAKEKKEEEKKEKEEKEKKEAAAGNTVAKKLERHKDELTAKELAEIVAGVSKNPDGTDKSLDTLKKEFEEWINSIGANKPDFLTAIVTFELENLFDNKNITVFDKTYEEKTTKVADRLFSQMRDDYNKQKGEIKIKPKDIETKRETIKAAKELEKEEKALTQKIIDSVKNKIKAFNKLTGEDKTGKTPEPVVKTPTPEVKTDDDDDSDNDDPPKAPDLDDSDDEIPDAPDPDKQVTKPKEKKKFAPVVVTTSGQTESKQEERIFEHEDATFTEKELGNLSEALDDVLTTVTTTTVKKLIGIVKKKETEVAKYNFKRIVGFIKGQEKEGLAGLLVNTFNNSKDDTDWLDTLDDAVKGNYNKLITELGAEGKLLKKGKDRLKTKKAGKKSVPGVVGIGKFDPAKVKLKPVKKE